MKCIGSFTCLRNSYSRQRMSDLSKLRSEPSCAKNSNKHPGLQVKVAAASPLSEKIGVNGLATVLCGDQKVFLHDIQAIEPGTVCVALKPPFILSSNSKSRSQLVSKKCLSCFAVRFSARFRPMKLFSRKIAQVPRKLFIFIDKNCIYRIKVSEKKPYLILKKTSLLTSPSISYAARKKQCVKNVVLRCSHLVCNLAG